MIIPFPIYSGESYEFQIIMTAFADFVAGDSGLEALMNDPLNLTLPPGVTFTSASGEFPGSAIPEPASWVLVGAGLLLCPRLFRRRVRVKWYPLNQRSGRRPSEPQELSRWIGAALLRRRDATK